MVPVASVPRPASVTAASVRPSARRTTNPNQLAPLRRWPQGPQPAKPMLRRTPVEHLSSPGLFTDTLFTDTEYPALVLAPEKDHAGQYRTSTGLLLSWTEGAGYTEVATGKAWAPAAALGAPSHTTPGSVRSGHVVIFIYMYSPICPIRSRHVQAFIMFINRLRTE